MPVSTEARESQPEQPNERRSGEAEEPFMPTHGSEEALLLFGMLATNVKNAENLSPMGARVSCGRRRRGKECEVGKKQAGREVERV